MENEHTFHITPTIKDVAKEAGVSIATVSRILNGTGKVSVELANRVQAAVDKLQYHPNSMARALKIRESQSIGLIIPDIENPFFPALVRGVEDMAKRSGYAVILCNSDGNPDMEEQYLNFLISKRVDGILFTGGAEFERNARLLGALDIPLVLLDRRAHSFPCAAVVTDNRLGAQMAVEHLITLGRREIAFISGPPHVSPGEERVAGYRDALAQHGLEQNAGREVFGAYTFESGYQAIDELVADGMSFDAIFAGNDLMAIGAMEALSRHGLSVPDDVAVIGYDDIRMSAWYKPALTTVHQPVYQMGYIAAETIIKKMTGGSYQPEVRILMPRLIIRQSCGGGREGDR